MVSGMSRGCPGLVRLPLWPSTEARGGAIMRPSYSMGTSGCWLTNKKAFTREERLNTREFGPLKYMLIIKMVRNDKIKWQ